MEEDQHQLAHCCSHHTDVELKRLWGGVVMGKWVGHLQLNGLGSYGSTTGTVPLYGW